MNSPYSKRLTVCLRVNRGVFTTCKISGAKEYLCALYLWFLFLCLLNIVYIGNHSSPRCVLLHGLATPHPNAVLYDMSSRLPPKFLEQLATHISHVSIIPCVMRSSRCRSLYLVFLLCADYKWNEAYNILSRGHLATKTWIYGNRVLFRNMCLVHTSFFVPEPECK